MIATCVWIRYSGTSVRPRIHRLTRLVLATPADLGLETAFDRVDRAARSTGLAGHEEDTILLRKQRVGRFTRLARDVLDDVASEDVLDLLLLEAALDDEAAGTVDAARCTHLGEEELDDVFGLRRVSKMYK